MNAPLRVPTNTRTPLIVYSSLSFNGLRSIVSRRFWFHVDQFPAVAVQILEAVLIHKSIVFRFLGGYSTGRNPLSTIAFTFSRLSNDRQTSTSAFLLVSQISFEVNV